MKVSISSKGKRIFIPLPSFLLFNGLSATITCFVVNKKSDHTENAGKLDPKAMRALFREISRCRRRFKNWDIVEIDSNGGRVKVNL